jgi:hypothetical protein
MKNGVFMKEALSSSETPDLTGAIRRNVQEDAIFHLYFCIWKSFLLEAEQISGSSASGRIR